MTNRTIRTLLLAGAAAAALLAFAPGAMAHNWRGDRNHDRIPDRWERAHHLSLKVNQAPRDQDRDGLKNRGEFRAGDNPRKADSDDDGTPDGQEKAGTVTSFTAGVLIIHLFTGDDVKGTVDANTEIECKQAQPMTTATKADDVPGDDDGPGDDDHQGGPGTSGDQGDDDNDQGDDGNEDDDDRGQAACDASALKAGAVVKEAELRLTATGAVFTKVEILS